MRAVTYERYGPPEVLRISDVERAVPKDDEVLVRVHATTATRSDCGLRSAEYFISRFSTGIFRPRPARRILGTEFAGEVDSIRANVTDFSAGDRVFGIRSGLTPSMCAFARTASSRGSAQLSFAETGKTTFIHCRAH